MTRIRASTGQCITSASRGNGFALERTWFRSAEWNMVAAERSLDVNFGAVSVSITALPG